MLSIRTLQDFYDVMQQTLGIRRYATALKLNEDRIPNDLVDELDVILSSLQDIPQEDGRYILQLDEKQSIPLDLTYEITELQKDIAYLTRPEDKFISSLIDYNPHLADEVNSAFDLFINLNFQNFIADRDGTVNNYCGRYTSSIQSIYNAVFIYRFTQYCAKQSVILTSAPLEDPGLLDMNAMPEGHIIFAGSKGREYYLSDNKRGHYAIAPEQQDYLNRLNHKIKDIIEQPEYSVFSLIGSGLQFKYGQTTIARQDIHQSIPQRKSEDFLKFITNIVKDIDPGNKHFRIEDTGKDIEIILTIEKSGESLKDFDKGDGLAYLNEELGLEMDQNANLICGDTFSDIPMARQAYEYNNDSWTIFVTQDHELKHQVQHACPNSHFLSTPDTLVVLLNSLAIRK